MKGKESYKLKRLRDGAVIEFDAAHALNLLRLNAKQSKSEYELEEKNYIFGENEIYKRPNTRKATNTEVQSADK